MACVNRVVLLGNLGGDPESRQVGNQTKTGFSLATSRSKVDKQGNRHEHTQWHRVICWGGLAEAMARHGHKGMQVYLEGSLETREYEHNGARQKVTEVNARQIEFLGTRQTGAGAGGDRERGRAPGADEPPARDPLPRKGGFSTASYDSSPLPGDDEVPF